MAHLLTEDFSSDDESYELIDHPSPVESINREETITFSSDTLGAEVEVTSEVNDVADDSFNDDVHPSRMVRYSRGPNGLFGIQCYGKMICGVAAGSPAEQQGLTKGDVIVAIDGVNVEGLSDDEFDALLKNSYFSLLEVRFEPGLLEAFERAEKETTEDSELAYEESEGEESQRELNQHLIEDNHHYQEEIAKKDEMIRQLLESEEEKDETIKNLRQLLNDTERQRFNERARADMLKSKIGEKDSQLAQIHDTVKEQQQRLEALLGQLKSVTEQKKTTETAAVGEEEKELVNTSPSNSDPEQERRADISVNLKAFNGRFLRVQVSSVTGLEPCLDYNQCIVEDHVEQVTLRVNNTYDKRRSSPKYLRALTDGRVDCFAASGSKWTPVKNEDGKWSFRSFNGRWLSARRTDGLICTSADNGKYERFELVRC